MLQDNIGTTGSFEIGIGTTSLVVTSRPVLPRPILGRTEVARSLSATSAVFINAARRGLQLQRRK